MREWNPVVSSILTQCSNRLIPLTRSEDCDVESFLALRENSSTEVLFPNARNPEAAYSALLLLLGCWRESHDLIDDDERPDGCYVHAIVHRIEPDAGNSAYWFRRVGQHPLFAQLYQRVQEIFEQTPVSGWQLKSAWDPYLFNQWCEEARRSRGTNKEKAALAIQRAEWDLLFAWCASPANI